MSNDREEFIAPDPIDDASLQPVTEEQRYSVIVKLLDERLIKMISYIKDDKDRSHMMMIQTNLKTYEEIMTPLTKVSEDIAKEARTIVKIYSDHITQYLEGMIIRKGWRPEQIATILASEEKARRKMQMGLFDDDQQKGVKDLAKLQG